MLQGGDCVKNSSHIKQNVLTAYHCISDDTIDATSYGGELIPVDNLLRKKIRKEVYKEYAICAHQMEISNFADDEEDALTY
jgi:hypothetical protein